MYCRLQNQVGNVATWTEDHWEIKSNEYEKFEIDLLSTCTAESRIIFPHINFPSFRQTCKIFQGQPTLIKNQLYLQQIFELMKLGKCGKCILLLLLG